MYLYVHLLLHRCSNESTPYIVLLMGRQSKVLSPFRDPCSFSFAREQQSFFCCARPRSKSLGLTLAYTRWARVWAQHIINPSIVCAWYLSKCGFSGNQDGDLSPTTSTSVFLDAYFGLPASDLVLGLDLSFKFPRCSSHMWSSILQMVHAGDIMFELFPIPSATLPPACGHSKLNKRYN